MLRFFVLFASLAVLCGFLGLGPNGSPVAVIFFVVFFVCAAFFGIGMLGDDLDPPPADSAG